MKKIVLTSLLAVFAVSGAQAANYFAGGAAMISMDETHTNILGIAPEVGWKYNENWDFGMGLNFTYDRDVEDTFDYGANIFARYKIAQFGNFKLLLRGDFGAAFETISSDVEARDGETTVGLAATIAPMVTYDVSETFTLYANLNFLGVNAGYNFENKDLGIDDSWNFNVFGDSSNVANTGAFQIGFLYNF